MFPKPKAIAAFSRPHFAWLRILFQLKCLLFLGLSSLGLVILKKHVFDWNPAFCRAHFVRPPNFGKIIIIIKNCLAELRSAYDVT